MTTFVLSMPLHLFILFILTPYRETMIVSSITYSTEAKKKCSSETFNSGTSKYPCFLHLGVNSDMWMLTSRIPRN